MGAEFATQLACEQINLLLYKAKYTTHRFFSLAYPFFPRSEEKRARKKKCEKEQSEKKSKKSENLSDFQNVRVKNSSII